jgi:HAD superfamily hydrolase (TIGR01548 family)
MIEGIIFDLDGVLLNVTESYRTAIQLTVKSLSGSKISQKNISEIKKINGFNNDWDATYALIKKIRTPLKEKEKNSFEYKKIVEEFQKIYESNELIKKDKLLIDKKVLQELSKNFKLGIVTGRPRKEALLAFKLNKLTEFFLEKFIIALEDCEEEKPSPKPLLKAMNKMKTKNAIYVGDTVNDVLSAKRAKIKSIFVGKEKLGDYRINSVNEILKVLKCLK